MKNDKLKSKDFFNAEHDPYFTFIQQGQLLAKLAASFTQCFACSDHPERLAG